MNNDERVKKLAKLKKEIESLSLEQVLKIKFEQMIDSNYLKYKMNIYGDSNKILTKTIFTVTLKKCDGNITKASRILGVSRATVSKKIKEFKINIKQINSNNKKK